MDTSHFIGKETVSNHSRRLVILI